VSGATNSRSGDNATDGVQALTGAGGWAADEDDSGRRQITSIEGIPALSLDAISSVAYGPEAMLVVLAAAGAGALAKIEPITVAIVILLVILVFSYRQVIEAYPGGGGSYAVSKANLGPRASHLAAACLVVDYVLTVAVSIAAGVAALVSAFPSLGPDALPIALGRGFRLVGALALSQQD
jgi:amino acid transporter